MTQDLKPSNQNAVLITKEGLVELKAELENLQTVRRKEVSEKIREAISFGDLSENAEYAQAKEDQAFIEGRITNLEKQIKNAEIIKEHKSSGNSIQVGSTVIIRNITKKESPETYTIVGSIETDPANHKISNKSLIGKSLIGRNKGDIFMIKAPIGELKYEIVDIK